jgi:hypothetical protein
VAIIAWGDRHNYKNMTIEKQVALDDLRSVLNELQNDMFEFDKKIEELNNLKGYMCDKVSKFEDLMNDLTSEE